MEEYLTTKEVAALLKIQPITVRRWIAQRRLPAIAFGDRKKEYRITRSDLQRFLEASRQ